MKTITQKITKITKSGSPEYRAAAAAFHRAARVIRTCVDPSLALEICIARQRAMDAAYAAQPRVTLYA